MAYRVRSNWEGVSAARADEGLHYDRGWSLAGPLDDDFGGAALHPRWSPRNLRLEEAIPLGELRAGGRYSPGLTLAVRPAAAAEEAPAITQALPAGDVRCEVDTWEGLRGLVCGRDGAAVVGEGPLLRAGLVVFLEAGGYVLVVRERGDDGGRFADRVVVETRLPGGPSRLAARRDVGAPFARLAIERRGDQARCLIDGALLAEVPAAGGTRVGLLQYCAGRVRGASGLPPGLPFLSFRVTPQSLPTSGPVLRFTPFRYPGAVEWDFGSFEAIAEGSGEVRFQLSTDGVAFTGPWLTADDVRSQPPVASDVVAVRASLRSAGAEQVVLRRVTIEGTTEADILVGAPPAFPTAAAEPSRVFFDWASGPPAPDVRAYEVLRRVSGGIRDQSRGTVDTPRMSFDDSGVSPGRVYEYRVRAIYQDGRAGAPSVPLRVSIPLGGRLERDLTLDPRDAPQVVVRPLTVAGTPARATRLTLRAGTVLKFAESAFIEIGERPPGRGRAALVADGTEDQPVVFTAASDVGIRPDVRIAEPPDEDGDPIPVHAGSWAGIRITANADRPRLRHAWIRYAGSRLDDLPGAVTLEDVGAMVENARVEFSAGSGIFGRYTTPAPLEIRSSVVSDSGDEAVVADGAGDVVVRDSVLADGDDGLNARACASVSVEGSMLLRNRRRGVSVTDGPVRLRTSDVERNREAGLVQEGTAAPASADGNWWGSPRGPNHPAVPGGDGDFAADAATVTPFARMPRQGALAAPGPPRALLSSGTITGTTDPGLSVLLLEGDRVAGRAVADASGRFRIPLGLVRDPALVVVGRNGERSPRGAPAGTPPADLPTIRIVAPGQGSRVNAARIEARVATTGADSARAILRSTPSNQSAAGPAADLPLAVGANLIDAEVGGARATPVAVFLDPTLPDPPTITEPADGLRTGTPDVRVAGAARPRARVSLVVDGSVLGTVVADAGGRFAQTLRLGEGEHRIRASDGADSPTVVVAVRTAGPVIDITRPGDGAVTDAADVTIGGTYRASGLDRIVCAGRSAETYDATTVDGDELGTFQLASVPLQEGENLLVVEAVDSFGNPTRRPLRIVRSTRPPAFVRISPLSGTVVRSDTIRLDGVVDDPAARVLVNGTDVASPGGRFQTGPLQLIPGGNRFVVEAVGLLGSRAAVEVAVVYDRTSLFLDGVAPEVSIPGGRVRVRGTGFASRPADNRIGFNGVEVPALSVSADQTLLDAAVPDTAISGFLDVRTPAGVSNRLPLAVSPLQTIQVVPMAAEINAIGGTTDLLCVGGFANGDSQDLSRRVAWRSTSPGVAAVDALGTVTGRADGRAQVLAEYLGRSGASDVVVEQRELSILVLLDVSGSMGVQRPGQPTTLDQAKAAAQDLIARLMPGDRVALLTFSDGVNVVTAHTPDRASADAALRPLRPGGATVLYDAILDAVRSAEGERTRLPASSHSILILSDGVDTASRRSLQDAVTAVNRAGIPAYFVYVDGFPVPGGAIGPGSIDTNPAYDITPNVVRNDIQDPFGRLVPSNSDMFYGIVVVAGDQWNRAGVRPGDIVVEWKANRVPGTNIKGTLITAQFRGFRTNVMQPGMRTTDRQPLERIAGETGNRFYLTRSASALPQIFAEILSRSRVSPIRLRVEPPALAFPDVGSQQAVRLIAEFANGTSQDVTATSLWATSDARIVAIVQPGLLRSAGPGEASVVGFLRNGLSRRLSVSVASAPVIRLVVPANPLPGTEVLLRGSGFSTVPAANQVTLDGRLLPVRSAAADLLVVSLPPDAAPGALVVTVAGRTSAPFPVAPDPSPAGPEAIRAVPMDRCALLSWDHPPDFAQFAGYRLYRQDPRGVYERVTASPLAVNVFRDEGLENGARYVYRLFLVDARGGERRFGAPTPVVPERFDIFFEHDSIPTYGSAPVARPIPRYAVRVVDERGTPRPGMRVLCESEDGILAFDPDELFTAGGGEVRGRFAVAPGAAVTANRLLRITVFAGPAAELVEAGGVRPDVRALLVGPEVAFHLSPGDRLIFTTQTPGLPQVRARSSRALVFQTAVIDARVHLAIEDFFVKVRDDREIPGFFERPLDTREGRERVARAVRGDGNFLRTLLVQGLADRLTSRPIVADLALALVPLGDLLDIGGEIWRAYVFDESPRYGILALSGVGLLFDFAELTGVGTPVGILGNILVAVGRRVLRLVPTPVIRIILE
jgi:Mg-chelatase subunit ChlD